MCSQYSPSVEHTLCVTFWPKSLNESWCQTQWYGYTDFDCSLSQSHLPETAVALKHQEYSHTFYRVTPNMCIIYKMGSDCLCCLFLVTVDIMRAWLPHVTEFCTGVELGRCTAPRSVFSQPYGKRAITWGAFYGFKNKRLFRMNLLHGNTDNISHVPILTWPSMTSSITSHGSVNDITWHFSWNSFLMLSFDTKMSHLRRQWKVLRANQYYGNLPFIAIDMLFRKTIPLKNFHRYFLIPILSKILLHWMYQMV